MEKQDKVGILLKIKSFKDIRARLKKIQSLVNIGKSYVDKEQALKAIQLFQDPYFQSIKFEDLITEQKNSLGSTSFTMCNRDIKSNSQTKRSKSSSKYSDTNLSFTQNTASNKNIQNQFKSKVNNFMLNLLEEKKGSHQRPKSVSPHDFKQQKRKFSQPSNSQFKKEAQNQQFSEREKENTSSQQIGNLLQQRQLIIYRMLKIGGVPFIKFVDFLGMNYFTDLEQVKLKYNKEKIFQYSNLQQKRNNKLQGFNPSKKALLSFLEGQKLFKTQLQQKKLPFKQNDVTLLRIILLLLNQNVTEDDLAIPYKVNNILQQTKIKHSFQKSKSVQQVEKQLFVGKRGVQEKCFVANEINLGNLKKYMNLLFNEKIFATQIQCIQKMLMLIQEIAKYLGIGSSSASSKRKVQNEKQQILD